MDKKSRKRKDSVYQKTEKLLRAYPALKEHVSDESAYMDMIFKGKSKSITSWSSTPSEYHEDQALHERFDSLQRSKTDIDRIEKAISKADVVPYMAVIESAYFYVTDDGRRPTNEEIAQRLHMDPRTVSRHRKAGVERISVYIFGSDAIM